MAEQRKYSLSPELFQWLIRYLTFNTTARIEQDAVGFLLIYTRCTYFTELFLFWEIRLAVRSNW